jgi:two-component sensor histidine kinase
MQQLAFELSVSIAAPFEARALTRRLAGELDPMTLDALRLVVSELVANAVKYGPGIPIRVTLDVLGPTRVHGEVLDGGDPSHPPHILARAGAHGGFGLRLVDALASAWGVRDAGAGVWFELGG